MSKKHYLISETNYFIDPHGEADLGGSSIRVEFTDAYNDLDLSKTYNEDLEESDMDEWSGSEDGYNSEEMTLDIKEITEEQYFKYSDIINNYNTLLNSL